MAVRRLRFPLGDRVVAHWICTPEIEGLIEANVRFCRQAERDELITLDEFEMSAGPDDFEDGGYTIRGMPPRTLRPGTYRPRSARIRVCALPEDEVSVDLGRYANDFAIVLYDDSAFAPAGDAERLNPI
jgi:hypothetical protein